MKAWPVVAVLAALVIGYVAGCRRVLDTVDPMIRAARVAADSARQASLHNDSLAAAAQAAQQAVIAGLRSQLASRQSRAAHTGSAASSLLDSVLVLFPDTVPLQRLRLAWSLHLIADESTAVATARLLAADSLALLLGNQQLVRVQAERDTAQMRLDRAISLARPRHGWKTDAVLVLTGLVVGAVAAH